MSTTQVGFDPDAIARELRERMGRATDAALSAGADQAEAIASYHQNVSVNFEKGDLKLTQVDEGSALGVRVFKERRLGFASTNQADEASLERAARDAVELAGFNPPDEANVLPDPRPIDTARAKAFVHPDLAALEIEDAVKRGRQVVTEALAPDPRLSLDQASFSLSRTVMGVKSSAGVDATEADCGASFSVFGMAVDGEDVGGFHYAGDYVRDPQDIDEAITVACNEFSSIALGNLGSGAAESYKGPVLFSPAALLSIFVSPLVSAASSIAVQRGRSALAGKIGERVAIPGLHIIDDPTDIDLAGATTCDREGIPAERFPLVEDGILSGYLYNGYSGRVDGVPSTGHARGGTRSVPGLGAHSLCVAGSGGGSRADLFRTLGRGLYVQRFSGTVDPASGDFSGVAKSARWVENGEIVRPVRETLLSGNAFDLLKGNVTMSDITERVSGSARAPYVLVDGVSVTAG